MDHARDFYDTCKIYSSRHYLRCRFYMASTDKILTEFLILRSRNRDEALKYLMNCYGDTMYGVVCKIISNIPSLADDALQEGFIKVWKNIPDFNPERASLFTWMFTIIKNSAIDLVRKEARNKIHALDSSVYETIKHSEEANVIDTGLMQKIEKLDPKYRQLIDMVYLKGYTQQEISNELNLPLGTVKTRIQTAVKTLRSLLSVWMALIMMFFK